MRASASARVLVAGVQGEYPGAWRGTWGRMGPQRSKTKTPHGQFLVAERDGGPGPRSALALQPPVVNRCCCMLLLAAARGSGSGSGLAGGARPRPGKR
jgi:hypothetical protein